MERREQILDSAQILFGQFGLKKVTTDDIAREAKVSKGTIYKHFRNKNEIFNDVLQAEIDQLLATIREAVDKENSPMDKLKAHLITRIDKVSGFVNFYRVTYESWGDYWPYIAQVRKQFLKAEEEIVREILKYGVDLGDFDIPRIDRAALILVIALASVEFQWALEEQKLSLPAVADMMIDMMINGIGRR